MKTLSEIDFSQTAEKVLDSFFRRITSSGKPAPSIQSVSIFETNASALILYYLRKQLKKRGTTASEKNGHKPLKRSFLEVAWFSREAGLSCKALIPGDGLRPAEILFVSNVARQHESLLPVIRELAANNVRKIAVASKTPVPDVFRCSEIRYVDWSLLRDPGYLLRLISLTRQWRRYWRDSLAGPLAELECRPAFEKWFEDKLHASVRALLLAEKVIRKVQPRIIITVDPADFEAKGFALIGRSLGIPSLCLQYGMVGWGDSEWRYVGSDYVGAIDSEAARILEGHGIPKEKIFLTGNPRFDSYQADPFLRQKVREELRIPEGCPLIAFMSVPPAPDHLGQMESYFSPEEHENLLRAVYRIPVEAPEWILAVKPHPEENWEHHRSLVLQTGPASEHLRLIDRHNSYQLINAADVVMTTHSTTGLEAIYMDKPLVTINFTSRRDYGDYATSGAALAVRRPDDLFPAIQSLLQNESIKGTYKEGRRRYRGRNPFFQSEKSSARRCAEVILALKEGHHLNEIAIP
jgi:hypothetical protein